MAQVALVYYSQTGTTEKVANEIAAALNVKANKIQPQVAYSSADINWHNDGSRANKEQRDDSARPKIKPLALPDYDTLILGYPTWWGVPPRMIDTFIESQNLKGKTVIPFATSGSTGPSQGVARLRQLAKGAKVLDGTRMNDYSEDQVKNWLKKFNL